MSNPDRHIWVDGDFLPDRTPVFMAETKGLMYGAGCFETFLSYNGKFLHLEDHLERLAQGLYYLGVSNGPFLNVKELRNVISKLLGLNRLSSSRAVIRIQCSLSGGRGYGVDSDISLHSIVSADPVSEGKEEYRLALSDVRAVPGSSRPSNLKLSNAIHYMKAWQQADRYGADDALILTRDALVSETALANIFWKSGDRIYTPSEDCDLLPGIQRRLVSSLIGKMEGVELVPGRYRPEELMQADLVWITNSMKEILPVTKLEKNRFPNVDPFYTSLFNLFEEYKRSFLS